MYQELTVVGNVGKDPELKYLPSGTATATLSLAINDSYKKQDGTVVKETWWFRVSTFGKLAEVCAQYVQKGKKILVVGKLRGDPATGGPRIWTANDGTSKASFEMVANTVKFLDSKGESNGTASDEEETPF